MKRKITTIKNKRLVEGGGENLLTKNEILVETKGDTITLKERDDSGKIKELSGSSEGSSISENKKYFKAKVNIREQDISSEIEDLLYMVLGNVPVYKLKPHNGYKYSYVPFVNAYVYHEESYYESSDIPYYVIDFNSNDYFIIYDNVFRYNNYPHIVFKNAAIEAGQGTPEETQTMCTTIETLFNQIFVEITKEEYLEIHNQCIAGTYVPEWE